MQLDVTWLFDDFNGNTPAGQTYRSTYYNNSTTSTSTTKSSTSIQAGDTGSISSIILSWDNLKEAKIPKFALMVEREHA